MTRNQATLTTTLFLLLSGCPADEVADTDIDGTSSTSDAVSSSDSHSTTVNTVDTDASSTGESGVSTGATSGSDDGTSDASTTSGTSTMDVEVTSSTSGETGDVCEYGIHCPNTDDCTEGQVCATEFGTLPVCVSPCDAVNDCTNAAAQCEGLSLHCAPDAGTGANLCFPD